MTATTQNSGFLDTVFARIIAFLIALALAFLLWSNWSSDFKAFWTGSETQPLPNVSVSEPAKPVNPALEACLKKRVGDVDKMKEDGILSDAQYAAFRTRAEDLCKAQNQ